MSRSAEFEAPWSTSLRMMTLLGIAILVGVGVLGVVAVPASSTLVWLVMVVMPVLVLACCALCMIRGYRIESDRIVVRRLGWESVIPIQGLESATHDAEAMARSIKLFGNGGLFCFAGKFRNKVLGNYRAFATDPSLSTVLRFSDRVVVVTPDQPRRFIQSLERIASPTS